MSPVKTEISTASADVDKMTDSISLLATAEANESSTIVDDKLLPCKMEAAIDTNVNNSLKVVKKEAAKDEETSEVQTPPELVTDLFTAARSLKTGSATSSLAKRLSEFRNKLNSAHEKIQVIF